MAVHFCKRIALPLAALTLILALRGGPRALFPGRPERRLTEFQRVRLVNRLKVFGRQKFWIILDTGGPAPHSEPENFAHQLEDVLVSVRWIRTRTVWQRIGVSGFRQVEMHDYSKGGNSGILIFTPPESKVAAAALDAELRGASLVSSLESDENLRGAILLIVGSP
jgi:hypothetical protein